MDTTSSSSSQFYSSINNNTSSNPMGEAVRSNPPTSSSGIRSREMESLSLEISKYPRDLLQLATNPSSSSSSSKRLTESQVGDDEDEDEEGLNLGLGLSLGGKFGVDKYNKGLKRSSSIIGTMPFVREDDLVAPPQPPPSTAAHGLARTASLPLETEEEWRRRKEMQTLRRMEAKRRRFEKQRVVKETGGVGIVEDKGVETVSFRGRLEKEQQNLGITNKFGGGSSNSNLNSNPFGSSPPPPPKVEMKRRRTTFGSLQGFLMAQAQAQAQVQTQGCSQGSGDSQGGSSSGASEHHQGSSNSGEARSPGSSHSTQERGSTIPIPIPNPTTGFPKKESNPRRSEAEESSGKLSTESSKRQEGGGIEDMPCVFTIGDGPHGRKVEGILYKYGRGEEVRIMCVCHGSFFSPAEFVKHAGGTDVDHPLRHIVVSPSPPTFP